MNYLDNEIEEWTDEQEVIYANEGRRLSLPMSIKVIGDFTFGKEGWKKVIID